MQNTNHDAKNLKVLVGQIKSIQKDVKQNIGRITKSIERYTSKDQIDVFILPEMALTGYTFQTSDEIKPFLEKLGEGPTFEFCRDVALNLNSYVICGYPEIDGDKFYNSALVVDRQGKVLLNHRKHFLFETDKIWAQEGPCFSTVELINTKKQKLKACVAICMDINPYEFQDSSKFELANFCKQERIDVILFISAWNDHEPTNQSNAAQDGILNYWLWRLRPLINVKQEINYDKPFAFICSDRVGQEAGLKGKVQLKNNFKLLKDNTYYIGCSCIVKVNPVEVVKQLNKQDEGYIIGEINI